jgi:hypothetical protein
MNEYDSLDQKYDWLATWSRLELRKRLTATSCECDWRRPKYDLKHFCMLQERCNLSNLVRSSSS